MNFTLAWPWFESLFGKAASLQHYVHQYTSPALAAGAQNNNTIRTNGTAYTFICAVSHHASASLAGSVGVLLQCGDFTLTVTVEDRNLQDGAYISTLYGNPVYSNVLANSELVIPQNVTFTYPVIVKPGGYLRFSIVNDNLANNIVRLAFHTVQVFGLAEADISVISPRLQSFGIKR